MFIVRLLFVVLYLFVLLPIDSIGEKKMTFLFDIPINANGDLLYTYENTEIICYVLSNDDGVANGVADMSITKKAKHGVSELLDNHGIYYKPDLYFQGQDSIVYRICNETSCDEATLYIQVSDWDFKPLAINDTFALGKGSREIIPVLANDSSLYDLPFSVDILESVINGQCVANNDGTITVTFNSHYIGNDSLVYKVCDKEGDCSVAKVFLGITNNNELDVFVPSGISPDGDGLNDVFFVPEFEFYKTIKHISLTIVNRWGELVYEEPDYQNNWGGMANKGPLSGALLTSGTYYYCFRIEGNSKPLTGYVYINR